MVANRTKQRIARREMMKKIIDNMIILYACNDTQLEKIPLIKLRNINIDTEDFKKWVRPEYRYMSKTSICPFDQDATSATNRKNSDTKEC